jgi:hypothetical protein
METHIHWTRKDSGACTLKFEDDDILRLFFGLIERYETSATTAKTIDVCAEAMLRLAKCVRLVNRPALVKAPPAAQFFQNAIMRNGSHGHDDAPRRGFAIGSHDMLGRRSTQVKREEEIGTKVGHNSCLPAALASPQTFPSASQRRCSFWLGLHYRTLGTSG